MAYYLDTKSFRFSPEPPGVRVPTAVLFLGVPFAGLAFLMFLPTVGFYLTAKWLLAESARGMARLAALLHREA